MNGMPVSVVAAMLSGVVGGFALGAVVGPVGVVTGVLLGVGVGLVAGQVMAREEAKASARSRELDDIIGVTHGRIGAAPLPPSLYDTEDPPPTSMLEDWASEWLTPPPPIAGMTPAPPGAR